MTDLVAMQDLIPAGRPDALPTSILGDVADDWHAAELWLQEVFARNKNGSEQTINTYRFHLTKLRWFCEHEIRVMPSRWTVREVQQFRAFLADLPAHALCGKKPSVDKRRKLDKMVFVGAGEPGWTPFRDQPSESSQGDILRFTYSMFSAWLRVGYIRQHPMGLGGAPQPKEVNVDRAITLDLYDLVLAGMEQAEKRTFTERQKFLRDYFIFHALRGLGLRASEMVGAKMNAFFPITKPKTGERFWVFGVTKKTGKGGYAREIPVPRSTWDAFLAYRKAYRFDPVPAEDDTTALVLSVRTKGVEIGGKTIKNSASRRFFGAWREIETRQGLYGIVKDRLRATAAVLHEIGDHRSASQLENASPHWLRHTFGKSALLAGQKTREVTAALGHADESTSMRYTHQAALDLIEAWERERPGSVARDKSILATFPE